MEDVFSVRGILRGLLTASLLFVCSCRSGAGAASPGDSCLGPGRYEAGKGQPVGTCCAGLHHVDQLAAVEEGDEHKKVCATVPSPIYACVKGSCGDGICEEGEKERCGCPLDCPSARWEEPPPVAAPAP